MFVSCRKKEEWVREIGRKNKVREWKIRARVSQDNAFKEIIDRRDDHNVKEIGE